MAESMVADVSVYIPYGITVVTFLLSLRQAREELYALASLASGLCELRIGIK